MVHIHSYGGCLMIFVDFVAFFFRFSNDMHDCLLLSVIVF